MVSPQETTVFRRRLESGALVLAAALALLLLPCADAARNDVWPPRTFSADPSPVPPPDWRDLPFLRKDSARRNLLSGADVSRPSWMPKSEYTLPWMLGDRKPLFPADPSDGGADVAEAAATSSGNDGWLGANGAGVASTAAAASSWAGAGAGAGGGPAGRRVGLAQRRGVCSPVTASTPRIVVTTEADFVKRLKFSRKTTVLMTLKADVIVKKGIVFGPYYSCTILQADVTGNRTISYLGANQPILRFVETFNVIVWGINFWMGSLPTSPACAGLPELGTGVICPSIHVYKSFGIQIAQGYMWGRIDMYRTMNSRIDGMAITGEFPFLKSPGSVRIGLSGLGTRAIKSGIVLSNNDIYVVNTPVYMSNGAVGVQIVNNFFHQFTGNGVQCGSALNNAGSCMMTFIARNWFFPNTTITAKTDISNVAFDTHWISPGNAASCNYMLGGNSCFNLKSQATGVLVMGGACMSTFDGVNIDNGKENRIQYLWVKDYSAMPGSGVCSTVTTINCNTPTGKLWESLRLKYYNSPAVNRRWPFLSNICKSAAIGPVPCNVPTAGTLNAQQTGKCSGLPTNNILDLALLDGSKLPVAFEGCQKVPSVPRVNRFTSVRYTSANVPTLQFVNYTIGSLEVKPTSPIFKTWPRFVNCKYESLGLKTRSYAAYLAFYNQPVPLGFPQLLKMTTSHL
ncbi:hypothetical protein CLOM_g6823 [Closterium sp. NIES-68]|nr:hypothetical protein CLOM_g6823 [Closterium sp. NIES-68]GJP75031.1 hypothetical protein CLOP_g5527 [Closterium sp. NIES-67]